ncbi:xylulokinase [Kumtagia ephedrae]|uniref:Pentose kinase n=1 Tax=Kumtagia ephedrae TaxID=2116701 RepID=A0A2P7SGV2_9HYPH|nr:FGGY-family carbohydrate kinase [Mesorhizobium ephedrae]PSJ61713.1 pentose kinase [Mesorhizobium ephedrae]
MSKTVAAFDLGTGGVKAAIFRPDGSCVAERIVSYQTFYPSRSRHEQRPLDWWNAVVESLKALLAEPGVEAASIGAIALSGHSLGCVPLSESGELLQDFVPIWSDGRAEAEAETFFESVDRSAWYHTTGNGFPAPLYTLFKILWLRRNAPDAFARTRWIVGTKDFINYRLTGRIATDQSYASGTGVYDLRAGCYSTKLLAAAGLDGNLLPEIVASTDVVGEVLPDIADEFGLPPGVKVVAGGVDNSCMALGASTFGEGDAFSSMGSSSWLTVSSAEPLLDDVVRPYAFAHVVPGMFISATSIFSSGTSVNWVRENLMADIEARAIVEGRDVHEALTELALAAPCGARGLLFVPTLGGGTSFEGGPAVRGGFVGLDLQHGRADIMRATLEGIALGLRVALDELRRMTPIRDEMIMVGGGARSAVWRHIFADVFGCTILKTGVDQQAAALGAAGLALVGMGAWPDFEPIRGLHVAEDRTRPDVEAAPVYEAALAAYRVAARQQAELSGPLSALRTVSQ